MCVRVSWYLWGCKLNRCIPICCSWAIMQAYLEPQIWQMNQTSGCLTQTSNQIDESGNFTRWPAVNPGSHRKWPPLQSSFLTVGWIVLGQTSLLARSADRWSQGLRDPDVENRDLSKKNTPKRNKYLDKIYTNSSHPHFLTSSFHFRIFFWVFRVNNPEILCTKSLYFWGWFLGGCFLNLQSVRKELWNCFFLQQRFTPTPP